MQNLTVIENELVPVYETSTGEKVVYGSELHTVLGAPSVYREWIKRRVSDIDAIEDEDFQGVEISTPSGQTKKDHIIKLDTAKEMAMLERNEKGKQVRRYFIQVEKKYKSAKSSLADLSPELQAIIMHDKKIQQVESKVESVNQDLQDFKMDMPILGIEIDKITSVVKKKGVKCLGGKESNAYKDKSLRGKVYHDIYRELKRQFGVSTYKAIKRNQCDLAVEVVGRYELPYVLVEQIKDCNAQISMEVA
ncbi:ORF6C domain-containing protein [[Ruminococcus] torques]|uniref:ORF6C domain-containing protein n=1 Tax=[Ruminococcus] torques TaxID=33039 RepID=UPI0024303BA2|nr:ORF6C domain-containing protein [[Ruminococcus] torques]